MATKKDQKEPLTEAQYLRDKLKIANAQNEALLREIKQLREQHVADIVELVERENPSFCRNVAEAVRAKDQGLILVTDIGAFGLDECESRLLGACMQYAALKGIRATFIAMPEYPEKLCDMVIYSRRQERKRFNEDNFPFTEGVSVPKPIIFD